MEEIFGLLDLLEKDLIDLYEKIKKLSRYKDVKVFDDMIHLSKLHCNRIIKSGKEIKKPSFKRENIGKVQNLIKDTLFLGATQDDDYTVFSSMAKAERNTGLLYHSIAGYFGKLSEYYEKISEEIEKISKEEFIHEGSIWNEYKKRHPEAEKESELLPDDDIEFEKFD